MPFGELNNAIRISGARASTHDGGELAACFGWDSEALSSRRIEREGAILHLARAEVAGQPAALFARTSGQLAKHATDMAALYAYHAAVDWGVIADDLGLTIFNSHWLSEKAWFTLPKIQWADAVDDSPLLRALSPAGVVEGQINRLAVKQKQPTEFLKPVDDELVGRLDKWRDAAWMKAQRIDYVDVYLMETANRITNACDLRPHAPIVTFDTSDFLRCGVKGHSFSVYDMRDLTLVTFNS